MKKPIALFIFFGLGIQILAQEEPAFCTAQYDPVCGEVDTGIRCITTPCPSPEKKTFGNACELAQAKATFLYRGVCIETPLEEPSETNQLPTQEDEVVLDDDIQEILDQIEEVEKQIEILKEETTEEESQSWFRHLWNSFISWITFWN